jgi:hypothetical protein
MTVWLMILLVTVLVFFVVLITTKRMSDEIHDEYMCRPK